jgi:Flp pilus assembly protein protease CpaA
LFFLIDALQVFIGRKVFGLGAKKSGEFVEIISCRIGSALFPFGDEGAGDVHFLSQVILAPALLGAVVFQFVCDHTELPPGAFKHGEEKV